MIFETHAHYDDEQFNEDRRELLESMAAGGVGTIVNVSATYESCQKVVDMVREYPFMYASVGVHPDNVGSLNEETFASMKDLFQKDKVVAVGEIGLDYYWDNESHETQKKWFVRQLDLARELGLPVLIHSRDAAADTMQIMKEHAQGLKGVIHCYSYSKEMAKEYVRWASTLEWAEWLRSKMAEGLKRRWKPYRLKPFFLKQTAHTLHLSHTAANAITLCISNMWQRRLRG